MAVGFGNHSEPWTITNDARSLTRSDLVERLMKAIFNGQTVAESDATRKVEGNAYFPPESLREEFFRESDTHTTCSWKGIASYKTVVVDGKEAKDAAWFYPEPKTAAGEIAGYVAFWKGVEVSEG